jgi:hypothetical protein
MLRHSFPNHFLFISIQLSFKFNIRFVGPTLGPTNLIVNLKMK